MLAQLRRRAGWRHLLVVLALVALSLKMAVPTGFMPGTSLASPIILCPDQGPMPAMPMAHGKADHPSKAPHDSADHPCAFVGLGLAALPLPFDAPLLAPVSTDADTFVATVAALTPGRGLAAPPPPSRAPPALHT